MNDDIAISNTISKLDGIARSNIALICIGMICFLALSLNIFVGEYLVVFVLPFGLILTWYIYIAVSMVNHNSNIMNYLASNHRSEYDDYKKSHFISSISNNRISLFIRSSKFKIHSDIDRKLKEVYVTLEVNILKNLFISFGFIAISFLISFILA